ncbi:tetratricopeptide (TPR) repeat protein [Catalinimonas alkaloidigena]|uniref:RagB/SusD family nutrient uptake outer membrane protein n=1 Tax=Catalinimonas alkaloidigena TaxID=1075417 RepID=UPI0024055615|nr:RagB/SusD family nutrient uptake outer membrane protein [Catalinimonas alkaloidigena]MDF9796254.1 tetratricopeptide (TPR) repeat protein [Catalinimonas alkaloidigena]
MKTYKVKQFAIYKLLLLLSPLLWVACDNDEFLEEIPLDFYSPDNSYTSFDNFEASLYENYEVFRQSFYTTRDAFQSPRNTVNGTDMVQYDQNVGNLNNLLVPTSDFVYTSYWQPAYQIIYNANVILERSESEDTELTAEEKLKIQAEASFFRGYMYKLLADIYGGVPIVLQPETSPRRDFVRATRMETYQQAAEDLQFAAENLPLITEVDDSRISNLTAYHALAEAYLSLEQWDEAVTAASMAIDDPNTSLMTERFGSRVNDEFNPNFPWASGGDPYWDLFRQGNQNRSSGNTEALWVIQYAYNTPGGADGGYRWETASCPRTWRLNHLNNDGSYSNIIPFPNTYYGGRGAGQTKPSHYVYEVVWNRSGYDEDLRNADYNIIRDLKVNNPESDYHGQWVFGDNLPGVIESTTDTIRDWFPILAKIATMGDHPLDIWQDDQTIFGSISTSGGPANTTHRDIYQIRLAETYLVRAEAYLGAGDLESAAQDINIVRMRSNAPSIDAGDVNIDYLLDERARELAWEENRLQTLLRLGKLVERSREYGWIDYYDHQKLWPIPQSEIDKNTEAVLEQNPGY